MAAPRSREKAAQTSKRAKGDNKGRKYEDGASDGSGAKYFRATSTVGVLVLVVAALAAYLLHSKTAASPPSPLPRGLLSRFSAAHNASLLWGTYRPGLYFGLRTRTAPTALVAGLLWAQEGSTELRHQCEQDTLERYGFAAHDGESYATQPIEDSKHGISLTTSFVKPESADGISTSGPAGDGISGAWAARISVAASTDSSHSPISPDPKRAAAEKRKSVYLYLGIDNEHAAEATGVDGNANSLFFGGPPSFVSESETVFLHAAGSVADLGNFSLLSEARAVGDNAEHRPVEAHWWATGGEEGRKGERGRRGKGAAHAEGAEAAYLKVSDTVSAVLRKRGGRGGHLPDAAEKGATLLVLQFTGTPPFKVDLVFVPGGCGDGDGYASLYSQLSGDALTQLLAKRQRTYEEEVASRFNLDEVRLNGSRIDESVKTFAAGVLGAALGSVGYFHGKSLIASADGGAPTESAAASLFTMVPSRPFFPRGFLWDEGFHQMLLGAWRPAIADDVLSHWLALMDDDGWISREQILGAEARSRVPAEFVPQHPTQANPPALLLRIDALLRSSDELRSSWLPTGRLLWPRLCRWYAWLVRTQAGPRAWTYRWRGRDATDKRLNAMTLASGLDDYPRAHVPTDEERHADLLCWVAFFSRLLSALATALDLPSEAQEYAAQHDAQIQSLMNNHWHARAGAFCDWGLHANAGRFARHTVVKCSTADGSSAVEHSVADARRPNCPQSHPRLLFHLGDGQGGLLTVEKFEPRGLREQWVEHLGYVSLFPLMLRLLPAGGLQLPRLLQLLSDPEQLWTPYGIRSLSKADRMHGRANAPGDEPYWRGAIWINLNYLLLVGLKHYASTQGPMQERCAELHASLRLNLVKNMQREWERTGYLWEQYSPSTGKGQRTHPFNGWSALVLLALAEIY